jgi:ribosomal protein L19E
VIPSVGELKGKRYSKLHNATTHSTNECRVFRQHVQKAIEQGKIKFKSTKKLAMGIDGHPFLGVHMVEFQLAKEKTKVLMSAKAREEGLVDPKV